MCAYVSVCNIFRSNLSHWFKSKLPLCKLVDKCCLVAFNPHIRLHNKQLSKWDLHGGKQLLGERTKVVENMDWLSCGPPLWLLYYPITARRKSVYLGLLRLPPRQWGNERMRTKKTKIDNNEGWGYSRRERGARVWNVFPVQQWQHSDNESHVSIDWSDLYNKVLPSCVSIVNGSMKNVWQLLCFQWFYFRVRSSSHTTLL